MFKIFYAIFSYIVCSLVLLIIEECVGDNFEDEFSVSRCMTHGNTHILIKKSRKAYTLETKSENSLEGIVRPPLEISDKYASREVSARSLASISWVSHSSHLTIINHNASANKWETLVISNHHVKNYGSFVSFRGITRWTVLEVVEFGERFYSVFSVKSGS